MAPRNLEGDIPVFDAEEPTQNTAESGGDTVASLIRALDLNVGILHGGEDEDATNDEVIRELTRQIEDFRVNPTFETLDAIDQEIGRYEPSDEADRDAKLHFLKTVDLLRGQLTEEVET